MDELDKLYGPCLPADRPISEAEKQFKPKSLQRLDKDSGGALARYLIATMDLLVPQIIHRSVPILWIVNRGGDILWATEEVVNAKGEFVHVLPKGRLGLEDGNCKLGHPSLLAEEKEARIAGEIVFDPELEEATQWILTRSSGRFGRRATTRPEHLDAVAEKFRQYGVSIATWFD